VGEILDGVTMTLMELSFVLLWAGIAMGAIWADHSWGRPWGWDPKEVFALNTFVVFAVLVLLYKRVLPPFVNMGSLLLAPLGGGIALHIAGMAISMPVFIGLLMLLGIVAKNSILLVDMAIEEMSHGAERTAAILEAGHKRVQPIIMTTVAMVAGMLPIALSLGGDASFRAPMGVVVIGGLLMSTALTLVIVPASFSLAVGAEEWLAPRMKRWFTNNEGAKRSDSGTKPAPQPAE
jgi:predicted RND superfamily exporter protein